MQGKKKFVVLVSQVFVAVLVVVSQNTRHVVASRSTFPLAIHEIVYGTLLQSRLYTRKENSLFYERFRPGVITVDLTVGTSVIFEGWSEIGTRR